MKITLTMTCPDYFSLDDGLVMARMAADTLRSVFGAGVDGKWATVRSATVEREPIAALVPVGDSDDRERGER